MKGGFEISVGRWEAGDEGRLGCFQVPSCRRASSWEERLEPVNPARGPNTFRVVQQVHPWELSLHEDGSCCRQ